VPTAEQYAWQIALYSMIALIYGCAILFVVKASTPLRKWLGASFLVTYLENVVAFPLAMFGDERYLWLLGHPDTTLYFGIVLVSLATTLAGLFVFTLRRRPLRLIDAIPPLRASTRSLRFKTLVFSAACAVGSIVMSASGYFGYFTATEYLYSPPVWLDFARTVIAIGGGTLFVLFMAAGARHHHLGVSEWTVVTIWCLAGVVAGFKSLVVLPFLYLLLAAWLTGRLRPMQVAVLVASILLGYTVVEPLRSLRLSVKKDNALEALNTLISENLLRAPDIINVLSLFVSRVDYTSIGVEALEADRHGQLGSYRSRLSDGYRNLVVLAFLPRAVWPSKPLFDHGRELSVALTGIETNSVTPSGVVASYLWAGYPGVFFNAIVLSYLLARSGRLLTTALRDPLAYAPIALLALVVWTPESIVLARYVGILRSCVAVGVFYLIGGRTGLLRNAARIGHRRGHRALRPT
jgi:hypothetical protein